MKTLLQIGRVPWASLHLPVLGLYSVCVLGPFISDYVGTLPIWLQFALLESSSKDKIPFPKSSWLNDFFSLTKGSTMVLSHSYSCSISFLFELVQGLRELQSVISFSVSSPNSTGINTLMPNSRAYGVSLVGCLGVVR